MPYIVPTADQEQRLRRIADSPAFVRAIEASAGTPSLIEQAAATAARFAAARRSKGRSAAPCSDSVEGEPSPAGTPGGAAP